MKKTFLKFTLLCPIFALTFFLPEVVSASDNPGGKIYLQTEENGEAWYVYPWDGKRYYLGRPYEAFEIMRKLSLGARHEFINSTNLFPQRLSGVILLDVEKNGEAYYINPGDLKKNYLGRPYDAFRIMRELGIGITNQDLSYLPVGNLNNITRSAQRGRYITDVPFTPQAPFRNWGDQRQQDGCEEASALMAVHWARGEGLNYEEALEEILNASDYLQEKHGEYRDISAQNTVNWIFKDYFDYHKVALKKDFGLRQIIYEIKKGNLVIAPMNGQTLGNIYYTPPGPSRHMILIRGYDENKNTFITNDPGVGNGEFFEYDENIFYDSIRDYPTGYHVPIKEIEKNVIVVWK